MCVEGDFFFKISKRDFTFIREMRVRTLHYAIYSPSMNGFFSSIPRRQTFLFLLLESVEKNARRLCIQVIPAF